MSITTMPQPAVTLAPTCHVPSDREALCATPLRTLVTRYMLPQLDHFFGLLDAAGKELVIDGTVVFTGKDKFLPGKIAFGLSYLLLGADRQGARFQSYLEGYRRIAALTLEDDNDSWGIYYYVAALNRLREAGLLEQALDGATLARLRERLDWRRFVDVAQDYTLINLPTNYYGVAFSIARLRYLMGWEDASGSEVLLAKTIKHYETYSGEFGFSDETDGEGRFDRYSVLLIGEICYRFVETGMEVTPQLKAWLRKAVDVVLPRLNLRGDGFCYGRSIGAYGDTAFIEILSTAAWLGVLSPAERDMAYAFQVHETAKYLSFWFDTDMQSVNLWDKGRRTDAYRAKHRVLGENFTMLHHHIYTCNLWQRMGYAEQAPTPAFADWLGELPRFSTTWFARGEYDRALVGFRDGAHLIDLPIINGGVTLHHTNPYYPIPFSNELVQGAADADFPQLMPRFVLADGSQLTATAFFRHLQIEEQGSALRVAYEMQELNRLGERAPVKDGRVQAQTEYRLDTGCVQRRDRYVPTAPLDGVRVVMEFASFSRGATVDGGRVRFAEGAVTEFVTVGFDEVSVVELDEAPEYRAPMGRMHTLVRCVLHLARFNQALELGWEIRYR